MTGCDRIARMVTISSPLFKRVPCASTLKKHNLRQSPVGRRGGVGRIMTDISPALAQGRPGLEFVLNQPSARRKIALVSRLSSLVPCVIFAMGWLAAAYAVSVVAWFAILITGRYPSGLFAFNARAWRYLVRVNAYAFLLVDPRPSPSGNRDLEYPLWVDVTPLPEYNRLLTLLRFPILIPLSLVTALTSLAAYVAWFPSLLMVTLVGHQPKSLQRIIALYMRLYARFISSAFLLTEIWWVTD
jgi:hypothetical protein